MKSNADADGTLQIGYAVIDPASRTFTFAKGPRKDSGNEIRRMIQTDKVISREPLPDFNSLRTSGLHVIYHDASRTTREPFWYQGARDTAPVRYNGRAVVLASNQQQTRIASCRMNEDQMNLFFKFEEPPIVQKDPRIVALLAPAREAGARLMESIARESAENEGISPGYLDMRFEYRSGLAALEVLARYLDDMLNDDHRKFEDTDSDVITFFNNLHDHLIEQGYLNLDERSPLVADIIGVYGVSNVN